MTASDLAAAERAARGKLTIGQILTIAAIPMDLAMKLKSLPFYRSL